jgi:hypothetical protein
MKRNNSLFAGLFYAAAFGALLGWAIGTLIRRHREQQQRQVPPPTLPSPPVIPPPRLRDENGLTAWHRN